MHVVEATLTDSSVHMRFASRAEAVSWIEFCVPLSHLDEDCKTIVEQGLSSVAAVRLAALRRVQDAIGTETRRLLALLRA